MDGKLAPHLLAGRRMIVSKRTILGGSCVVCEHTKKWINAVRIELGLTEEEVVERTLNTYAHNWFKEVGIPLDSSYTAMGSAIRTTTFARGVNHGR